MRDVKFTPWIPKKGWQEEVNGKFHQWGLASIESERGNVSYTVAIVEDENGKCHEVPVDKIQFIFIDPFK